MHTEFPKHLGPKREFKQDVRRRLAWADKALDEARLGCLSTPAYHQIVSAADLIEEARRLCSRAEWGR